MIRYAINEAIYKFNVSIKGINVSKYYDFNKVVDNFYEIFKDRIGDDRALEVLFITTNIINYNIAKNKGRRVVYLYDYLDFTDSHFYLLKSIPSSVTYVLDSANNLTGDLIKNISMHIPPTATLYFLIDKNIPRRYSGEEDINIINNLDIFDVEGNPKKNDLFDANILNVLNKLKVRKTDLKSIIDKSNKDVLEFKKVDVFSINEYDISKIIITPHITIEKDLNYLIRRNLHIYNVEDECKPMIGERLISHGPATAKVKDKEITLPIGYVLKVKDVLTDDLDENTYTIIFDYTDISSNEILEAGVSISKAYIDYLFHNKTIYAHVEGSFKFYFAYVVGSYRFCDNLIDDGIIIFDKTLTYDKRDLYTCLSCIKNHAKIYYNTEKTIIIK